jgi:hypothetical protein
MDPSVITRPLVPVLAVVAGAAVLAPVPPMAGRGRAAAARGAPVPASAVGWLTAVARRATARNGKWRPGWPGPRRRRWDWRGAC